jgi:hypothetical protein
MIIYGLRIVNLLTIAIKIGSVDVLKYLKDLGMVWDEKHFYELFACGHFCVIDWVLSWYQNINWPCLVCHDNIRTISLLSRKYRLPHDLLKYVGTDHTNTLDDYHGYTQYYTIRWLLRYYRGLGTLSDQDKHEFIQEVAHSIETVILLRSYGVELSLDFSLGVPHSRSQFIESIDGEYEDRAIKVMGWLRGKRDPLNVAYSYGMASVDTIGIVPWTAKLCMEAASSGELRLLLWLRENGCPWDIGTCRESSSHAISAWLNTQQCPCGGTLHRQDDSES